MNYINRFQLIRQMVQNKSLDSRELLSDVDRHAVIQALQKTNEGVPKSFQYTNEAMEEENLSKMPQNDKDRLWDIYENVREYPARVLPQLLELQKCYPQVPCIYNYLATTYAYLRQDQQYFTILNETIRRFPEYLFGKISLAEYYVNHNDHRKVPGILGRKFQIYQHYPASVKMFHITEVRSFYGVVGRYFARSNKLARALFCYFTLEEVDPEHWVVRQVGDEIVMKEVETLIKDFPKNASKKRGRRKRKG